MSIVFFQLDCIFFFIGWYKYDEKIFTLQKYAVLAKILQKKIAK